MYVIHETSKEIFFCKEIQELSPLQWKHNSWMDFGRLQNNRWRICVKKKSFFSNLLVKKTIKRRFYIEIIFWFFFLEFVTSVIYHWVLNLTVLFSYTHTYIYIVYINSTYIEIERNRCRKSLKEYFTQK